MEYSNYFLAYYGYYYFSIKFLGESDLTTIIEFFLSYMISTYDLSIGVYCLVYLFFNTNYYY